MDSSARERRRISATEPGSSPGGDSIEILRALAAATTVDELDRMLLELAVHPGGPGFDRVRLMLWDSERERFTIRAAERAAAPPTALAEALSRGRAAKAVHESREAMVSLGLEDLDEPAASAWRHRVRLVSAAPARGRSASPRTAAAVLTRPSGAMALVVGEWDETKRRDDLEDLLERFATIADWAMAENARRVQEWMQTRQIAAVAELARTSASPCNLAEVLHQSARLACQATGAHGSALWLAHGGDAPRLEITHGAPAQRDRLGRAFQPIAAAVLTGGRAHLSDCAADEAQLSPDAAASIRSFAVVPLRAYERVVGVLAIYDPSRGDPGQTSGFARAELEALEAVADLTALAIDRAGRFEELGASQMRQRQLGERLARQERLASLGESAAGVAEEARHPMNSIRTFSRRAREAMVDGAPEREYLEIVLRETDRLERLLGEHLDRDAAEPPSLGLRNLNEIVQTQVQKIGEVLVRRRIRLLKKLSPELPQLLIDSDRIGQMVSRVLDNALETVSIGGRIRLETRRAGAFAVIEVAHDGPRSPGTALDHLFVPFASSKNGANVGFGMAQRIVREHGGEVRVRADGEWSTVVVFTLPIPDNQDRRAGSHERRQIRVDRRRRVPQPK